MLRKLRNDESRPGPAAFWAFRIPPRRLRATVGQAFRIDEPWSEGVRLHRESPGPSRVKDVKVGHAHLLIGFLPFMRSTSMEGGWQTVGSVTANVWLEPFCKCRVLDGELLAVTAMCKPWGVW